MAELRLRHPASPGSSAVQTSHPTDSDVHLLRLVLDLQLDALLITLRGASRASLGSSPCEAVRWRSWLHEDVHLAQLVAATLAGTSVARPGPADVVTVDEERMTDNLRERLKKIQALLVELSERPSAAAWQTVIYEALSRCHTQLANMGPLRPIEPKASTAHDSLPGEHLG